MRNIDGKYRLKYMQNLFQNLQSAKNRSPAFSSFLIFYRRKVTCAILLQEIAYTDLRFHECSISRESFAASSTSCRRVKIVCYVCRLFFHRLGLTMSYLRCKLIKLLPPSFFLPPVEIPLARRIFATCTCNETTRNMI